MSWEERPYADPNFGRGGSGFADNPLNWAPRIFTLDGIRVRLHITFILYVLFEILEKVVGSSFPGFYFLLTGGSLLVLFGSVFLHELGHCYACRAVGGRANEVLMWPLGGLAFVEPPRTPRAEFITVLCGPLVSLSLMLGALAILKLSVPGLGFFLFAPEYGRISTVGYWVSVIYQYNLLLFLFNLWPMYPMDAGRMLQCALWKPLGYRRATMITTTVGMAAAVVMGLYALVGQRWIMLTIATLGYMTCYRERLITRYSESEPDGFMGYDYSAGHAGFDRSAKRREGLVARWRRKRAETQRRLAAEKLQNVEVEVDRILAKVHRSGMQSLTRAEKRTLETATKIQQESERPRV